MLILDLRSNGGGAIDLSFWMGACLYGTGCYRQRLWSDRYFRLSCQSYGSPDTWVSSWPQIKGGLSLWGVRPDEFTANDNLVLVLTGNRTASSTEVLIDLLYNLSNVLLIGDNTVGCLLTDVAFAGANLPHSLIRVQFGKGAHILPEGNYFEETRGFLPDLWVPAAQAEELALKLLFKGD